MRLIAGFILFFFAVTLFTSCGGKETIVDPPPTVPDSLQLIKEAFADPVLCASCHPNHYNEWETSMHAYAVTDPVFQRLVEISQQRNSEPVDQFCIKCHSPVATLLGETPHGFSFGDFSSISKSAISCDVCHSINTAAIESGLGLQRRHFRLDRVRRSTISDPQPNSFHESEGDPAYNFSAICSSCHNIKAPDGNFFLEETNIEWDASPYLAMGLECQDCHMPVYSGEAALGGPQRDDLNRHYFVGVDYPLVDFPGKAETITRVADLLDKAASIAVEAPSNLTPGESTAITVRVKNDRTGHNIPSGSIFERQLWVELTLINLDTGDTLYASGLTDPNGDLRDHHSEFVKRGELPLDTALTLFRGIPLDAQGQELTFFWEAKSVQKNTIEAFRSHTSEYFWTAPQSGMMVEVRAKLRYRALPPYFLREIGLPELQDELLIFPVDSASTIIRIDN
jgi:nitrate/TMAO reductase-like tetraheme cytochrome c subunit